MKVVIAAGGRFHSFHLASQLNRFGYLSKIFTTVASENDVNQFGSLKIDNFAFGKFLDEVHFRLRLSYLIDNSLWYVFKDKLFDRWLSSNLENIEADIFVGWANYWLNSFNKIKKTGAKIIVESGSWHIKEQAKILEEEFNLYGVKVKPINQKNIGKMTEEYLVADYIMVPSKHVYNSFIRQGIDSKKLLKVSYGVDFEKFYQHRDAKKSKFRVVFVGQVSLQKGVHYLVEAWQKLNLPQNLAELLIVGPIQDCFNQAIKRSNLSHNIIFYGGISQEDLKKLYLDSSVFVLPSVHDGFGMVISEAMASGLPVICTTNTGGEELIENGKEGFILPIRDVDALAEKILWCYENRDACFEMGLRAQEKIKDYTWDHYGDKIIKIYGEILKQKS